jgi:hypothetical protein
MHRPATLIIIALLAGLVGFVAGWGAIAAQSARRAGRVVAVSWGDAPHARAYYGAFVYLRQKPEGYSVRGRVYLGRDGATFHDCGELGTATTPAEAVERWGTIDWQTDGVRIGAGTNRFFVSKADLEKSSASNGQR